MTEHKTANANAETGAGATEVVSSSVARSTALMSACTLMSRLTGFLRTWACAVALGNTLLTSAYSVANNLPNMLYELVAGGILSTAFLPVLMTQIRSGKEEGDSYAANLLSLCTVALGVLALLATVFAPQVIATQTFKTDDPDVIGNTVFFFRFFAVQVIFYGAGAVVSGYLNAHRRFLMPALGPVFNNICVIVAFFSYYLLSSSDPDLAKVMLAVGTSLGVALQCIVQIPALRKVGFRWRFRINLHDHALGETAKLAIPAIAFTAMNLVCVSFKNSYALAVSSIGPSTLSYAWMWFQLPYGVLAVALSTAMFTEMSDSAAAGDMDRYRDNVRKGLRGTFFMIIPMAVALLVLAPQLITLYNAGKFTPEDVARVATVLRFWALCLPMYAGYLYLYFAFSAIKRLKVVTIVNVFVSLVQIAGYATLTIGIGSFPGFGIEGIPITDIVFFTAMYLILFILLRREVGAFSEGRILGTVVKAIAAAAVGGVVMWVIAMLMGEASSILHALIELIVAGGAGLVVVYLVARLLRVDEVQIVDRLLGRVFGKLFRR